VRICFPVQKEEGMDSTQTINNQDEYHAHGACRPTKALNNQQIDAIVVGGIGAGALNGLNRMGLKIYRSKGVTIRQNIELYKGGILAELTGEQCCGGHSNDGGCAHS